jgi:threonine synthase
MESWTVSQQNVNNTILYYYNNFNYLLDPHSAIAGYICEEKKKENSQSENGNKNIINCCLCTACPSKFPQTVLQSLNIIDDINNENSNRKKYFNRFQDLNEKEKFELYWMKEENWENLLREKVIHITSKR